MVRFIFFLGVCLHYSLRISGARIDKLGCSWHMYMVLDDDGATQCHPCTVCPPGFQVRQPCSLTTDTVCELCPRRTYNPGSWQTCKKCTRCNHGDYVDERCTAATDTVCRKCPEMTYSPRRNSHYCFSCTSCKLNEDVILDCSGSRNTLCGNCSTEYFRDVSTGECLPCSRCPRKQPSQIVEECLRKLGHDRNICQPSAYLYQFEDMIIDDTTVLLEVDEVETHRHITTFEIADSFIMSVYILGIVLCSSVIFVIVFAIVQDRHVQRFLRRCRDKTYCSCDDDSLSLPNVGEMTYHNETSGSRDHVTTNALTEVNCTFEREEANENSSTCISTFGETSDCDVSSGYETSSSCMRCLDDMTSDDGVSFESDKKKLMAAQNDAMRTAPITPDIFSSCNDVFGERIVWSYDVTSESDKIECALKHCSTDAKSRRQKVRRSVCKLYIYPFKAQYVYHTI